MSKTTLSIGSITYAIKARKILTRINIDAEIVKITQQNNNGCSYGIKFGSERIYDVVLHLKENGVNYSFYSNNHDILR